MNPQDRKIFNEVSERLIQAEPTKEGRERLRRIHDQASNMPQLIDAFDAWCQSQELNMPIQAVLCAYVIGRNLRSIDNPTTHAVASKWLFKIVDEERRSHD